MGKIVAIFIRPEAGQPTQAMPQVHAVPGQGLEGDHHYLTASPERKSDASREVTLVEIESIEAVRLDYGIALALGDSRRNLVTVDVPLNHLVGKKFRVGEVTLQGIRLCEPCSHLAQLTQKGVLPAMVHRGGLRAQILTEGNLRVGDIIESSEVTKDSSL
jgi:MOSC domain-containing protein YiiM